MNDDRIDALVLFGGAAKALDDSGRFGGYLVLFGDAEHPDASTYKDYFAADTDYWSDLPATLPVIYGHGQDPMIRARRLGRGTVKADDDGAGLWLEGQLALRDAYEQKVWQMIQDGKLGLSSGSAPHLIRRDKQGNGTHKVASWPLVEASLTPTPAEPRILVHALKSLGLGGAAPAPSLAESLATLATDARGLVVLVERALKAREAEGRDLSAPKLAALKEAHAELGRLIATASAPAEARKRLASAYLAYAASGDIT
jgi:phage head maturation protease